MHNVPQRIPRRLPLLDAFLSEHAPKANLLGDTTVILIQHQLGSLVPLTRALFDLGLDPKRTYCVDIPYTANAKVQTALQQLGIPRSNFSPSTYNLAKPYAPYQRQRVQRLLSSLRKQMDARDKVLVMDDGSYFIEAASCYAELLPQMSVVEQTTRGVIKINRDVALQRYCARLPIVNVAESAPKKNIESPFIGHVVCNALIRRLARKGPLGTKDLVLILGYGAIGSKVAESIQREFGVDADRIYVTDPKLQNRRRARRAGHRIWTREPHSRIRFKLVVGCAGTTSFTISDRVFLEDGALLASASSGSAELSREEFIDLAESIADDDIYVKDRGTLKTRPIHSDIELRLVDRDVRFLNGGFPVNFDGRVNCVAPRLIQATHTLQIGAAVQAVTTRKRGVIDLDRRVCNWVTRHFGRHCN